MENNLDGSLIRMVSLHSQSLIISRPIRYQQLKMDSTDTALSNSIVRITGQNIVYIMYQWSFRMIALDIYSPFNNRMGILNPH